MERPEIKPYEDQAIDIVVSVINGAKEKLGTRLTLKEFAKSRRDISSNVIMHMKGLDAPLPVSCESFIREAIEKKWKLTNTFMYVIKYAGSSKDETTKYFYYEVIFSQPTKEYPIPQSTVTVFFRVGDKLIEAADDKATPTMVFRVEGHRTEHDVRYMMLTSDQLLAELQMKIKLFQRVEALRLF